MQLERDEASALERLCARLAESGSRPCAILGCSYPFEGSIFGEVLERIADELQLDHANLKRFPIDIVCDRKLYREHPPNEWYRVHLYPLPELFHPKLLIVLLEQEVVWLSGSANLTRAGYCSNREIMLLHEPGDLTLPAPLRRLLAKLPCDAARVIRDTTSDSWPGSLPSGRFVTSMERPIGRAFLSRSPRKVQEVRVLAPFFEQAAGIDSIDRGWLDSLRERFPYAKYRIYLPLLEPGRRPCVQGERALFKGFSEDLKDDDQLRFYPVPPDPGPLHGKLVAIVYRSAKGRRARILVGSPNPSRRALLLRRNIEVAWIVDIKASSLDNFLSQLNAGEGRRLDALRFKAPKQSSEQVWSALSRVVLDPGTRMLSLTWCDAHDSNDTDVFYGKRHLDVRAGDRIHAFELDAVNGALTTRPRRGKTSKAHVIPGHCPIEVQLVDQMLLDTFDDAMTPDDWLALLGRDPGDGLARGGTIARRGSKSDERRNADAFTPSEQVRDLAARIRYALEQFRAPFWSEAERDATLRVLKGVFDSHEPSAPDLSVEQRIWRGWVRAELVQFAVTAAKDPEVRKQGLSPTLKKFAGDLRRQLGLQLLPLIVRKQIRLVARGST